MMKENIYDSLSKLTGLTNRQCDYIMKILSCELAHEVAEDALESEGVKRTDFEISVPHIGTIKIEYNKESKGIDIKEFKLSNDFKDKLKQAINEGISPIESMASDKLAKTISTRYQALL